MVYIDDGDVVDFLFKPMYVIIDILREFFCLLYVLVGLLFLFFLIDKEFPGFKTFCEATLRNLNFFK